MFDYGYYFVDFGVGDMNLIEPTHFHVISTYPLSMREQWDVTQSIGPKFSINAYQQCTQFIFKDFFV